MTLTIDDLPRNNQPLLAVWGDPVPAVNDEIRNVADKALEGIIYFYGVHETAVGRRDIDWSGPQHQHQEWQAQLNRFFFLPPLAAIYRETGDERYAEAARDYLADWMRAHPTRPDWQLAPYDNVLNLCIRVGNSQFAGWLGTLPIFRQSPAFAEAFVNDVISSCVAQLECLWDHIAPAINWRIANADSLLVSGIRLAQLPVAEGWRRFGARVINDAWHRQLLPDGAHYERNPSYHGWMARVMTSYRQLARAMPELGLMMDAEAIARMYDYALACTRPNGSLNAMHDCQGERSGSRPNDALRQRAAFRQAAGLPDELPPTAQHFPHAGQFFLRDGWAEDATYLTFDATTWGGGHCHLSRNAVQLHALGRSLLVDPGYLTYESADPLSAHGKSTRAHNTLTLNGWNQGETDPVHTRALSAPGYDFVASDYEGAYWSGSYTWNFREGRGQALFASHNRMLFWIHGRAVVVIDSLMREPSAVPEPPEAVPSLEANWQLCEGGAVELAADRAVARYGDANLLMLFPLVWPEMTFSVHAGERDPLRGWLPGKDGFVPAPQLTLSREKMEGHYAELVTVLVPFAGEAPVVAAAAQKTDGQRPASLTLTWGDGTVDELWWTYRGIIMLGAVGEYETDGGLLYLQRDAAGTVTRACAVEATYLAPVDTGPRKAPGMITG
ncbi:MAG: heparinase II/III family protein [Armatimonadota bacterium]